MRISTTSGLILSKLSVLNSKVILMKALRKIFGTLLGVFALLAVIFGVLQSVFKWIANSIDDDHEVFADDEGDLVA